MADVDKETEKNIQELQILEQNLQSIMMQKQAFQLELSEVENALEELKKSGDEVYKIVGQVMIKAKKAKQEANKVPVKSDKKVYEQQIEDEYSDEEYDMPKATSGMPAPKPEKDSMLYSLTPQQLRQLQMDAIYGYDTIRKDRKAKKKAQQAKEAQEQKAFQAVSRAVNRPIDDDGWGVCFQ